MKSFHKKHAEKYFLAILINLKVRGIFLKEIVFILSQLLILIKKFMDCHFCMRVKKRKVFFNIYLDFIFI